MVEKKQSAKAEVLIVVLTLAILAAVWVKTEPGNPSITISIDPRRGNLQNVTISCYQCVPEGKDVWTGTVALQGKPTIDVSDPSGASVGMTLGFGEAFSLSGGTCTGYTTNSSCVIPINGSLPYTIGLNLQKTSSGGTLKMIVYYDQGHSLVLQTASGGFSQTVTYEAS